MLITGWYNNEKDWFPGEYFVYIKMSYDPETEIYYVLDQITSHKPLDINHDCTTNT